MIDVALASCARLPEPDPDAEPLLRALGAAGIAARTLAWDDATADFSSARVTLLRSTWNYPRAAAAFLAWSERTAAVSRLWNPLPAVRWNLHKGYLIELERRGLPIAPTVLVPRGSTLSLPSILAERGWDDVVIKPAISAASYRTLRARPAERDAGEDHLRTLAREGDVLVQRYLPAVEDYGERALVWVEGELTHAVRKSPRFSGEFESVSEGVEISPAERELALAAVRAVGSNLLYARIDATPGPSGAPVLMELELIEPSLFLRQSPWALERLVAAVKLRLAG